MKITAVAGPMDAICSHLTFAIAVFAVTIIIGWM